MITFCASGDFLIHIPVPENHAGKAALAAQIHKADVRMTNLETTVTEYDCYCSSFSGGTPMTAHPDLLQEVKDFGFQACGCANNHAMDFSFNGLLSTMRHLDAAGLKRAGIGASLEEASAPATIETENGKVAFFAQTAVYYGNDSGRAGYGHDGIPARPGVNGLRHIDESLVTREQMDYIKKLAYDTMVNAEDDLGKAFGYAAPDDGTFTFGTVKFRVAEKTGKFSRCNENDMQRTEKAIAEAKKTHDYIVCSIHSHQFPGREEHEVDYYVEEFCHRCIDAGADAVFGTGTHQLKAIEIYKGKPIFYCLGNFFFHPEYVKKISADVIEGFGFPLELSGEEVVRRRKARATAAMEHSIPVYQSMIPFWTMEDGKLVSIKLLPVELGIDQPYGLRGFPSPAKPESIIDHLEMVCQPYGTNLKINGDFIEVEL